MSQPFIGVVPSMAGPSTATRRTVMPRLHVLTDTRRGRDPLPDVAAVLAGAAACGLPVAIQVRAKELTDRELLQLTVGVLELRDAASRSGITVIVDDRADVAVIAGADGVHLGAHDLPVDAAARLLGPDQLVGGTARSADTAQQLEAAGVAYLGVGPAFATTTKTGLPAPLGPAGVQAVAGSTRLPVIAIGGVTADHVADLVRAGAHGVAVVSAVSAAADPQAATVRLLRALQATA